MKTLSLRQEERRPAPSHFCPERYMPALPTSKLDDIKLRSLIPYELGEAQLRVLIQVARGADSSGVPQPIVNHLLVETARLNPCALKRTLGSKRLLANVNRIFEICRLLSRSMVAACWSVDLPAVQVAAMLERSWDFVKYLFTAMSMARALHLADHTLSDSFFTHVYGVDASWLPIGPVQWHANNVGSVRQLENCVQLAEEGARMAHCLSPMWGREVMCGDANGLLLAINAADGGQATALLKFSTDYHFWPRCELRGASNANPSSGACATLRAFKKHMQANIPRMYEDHSNRLNAQSSARQKWAKAEIIAIIKSFGVMAPVLFERVRAYRKAAEGACFDQYDKLYSEGPLPKGFFAGVEDRRFQHELKIMRLDMCR